MVRKNKKGPRNTNSNSASTSSNIDQNPTAQNSNKVANPKGTTKASNAAQPNSAAPNVVPSNSKPKASSSQAGSKQQPSNQKKSTNTSNSKKRKPVKIKKPAPKAVVYPQLDVTTLPCPRCTHAPVEVRLKSLILFKQEYPIYCPSNIEMPPIRYYFKRSLIDMTPKHTELFRCVAQLVAMDKRDSILSYIISVSHVQDENILVLHSYTPIKKGVL